MKKQTRCPTAFTELPGPQHDVTKGLALHEQEDHVEEVQEVVRASILAAPGAQCRHLCIAAHKYKQLLHTELSDSVNNKQIKSSSLKLILDSPQHPTQRKEKAAG